MTGSPADIQNRKERCAKPTRAPRAGTEQPAVIASQTSPEVPPAGCTLPESPEHHEDMLKPAAGADAWLETLLRTGPMNVRDIEAAAAGAGMSMRTVERAKKRLGIKADRVGKGWCWSLPQERHEATAPQAPVPA